MFGYRSRSPGKSALLLVACGSVALVLAVGASAGTARHDAALASSVTYQDSTGESPDALDVASVTISNDDRGLLTFDLKFANRGVNAATDDALIAMDVDRNRSTGSPNWGGAEWILGWADGSYLEQWNGSDWVDASSIKTLLSAVAPNELLIRVNTSELGNATGFDFEVATAVFPSAEAQPLVDLAPDPGHGLWSYDVKIYVAPVLSATAIKCTPDPPRAGKPMVARTAVTVMRATTKEPFGKAKVTASATIAGKKLVGVVLPSSATGNVAVRWLVPKTAHGKMMRGQITATLENVKVTKTFSERVK
jgi:hypothetical protein